MSWSPRHKEPVVKLEGFFRSSGGLARALSALLPGRVVVRTNTGSSLDQAFLFPPGSRDESCSLQAVRDEGDRTREQPTSWEPRRVRLEPRGRGENLLGNWNVGR